MKPQHNREDERPTEVLADLPLTTEQADETKGGRGLGVGYFKEATGFDSE